MLMISGIAIFGLNGAGKSTLAHALAKTLGYAEMDVEDYYFPEQRISRKRALEGEPAQEEEPMPGGEPVLGQALMLGQKLTLEKEPAPEPRSGALPFSMPCTKEEVQSVILRDLAENPCFILSGVTMNWCEEILAKIGIAFWVRAPLETRLQRIGDREAKRFGARVRPGGDMYEQQEAFREMVAGRDPRAVEQTAALLRCPVYPLDGTLPVGENVARIMAYLEHHKDGEQSGGSKGGTSTNQR